MVLKVTCSNCISHNLTKHISDGLDVEIEMIILKIYFLVRLISNSLFVLDIETFGDQNELSTNHLS